LQLKSGEVIDPKLTLKDLKSGQHITKVKVDQLFLLMGRELETLDSVPAGNVLGEFECHIQEESNFHSHHHENLKSNCIAIHYVQMWITVSCNYDYVVQASLGIWLMVGF
jgi:hypothetical protein